MDPDTYRSMTGLMNKIPPQKPIPGESSEQNYDQNESKRPDTNWTVDSADISRGNLTMHTSPEDPRMSVGWKAAVERKTPSYTAIPWMTSSWQQPLMLDNWGEHQDKVSEATPRPLDHGTSNYPHPDLSLPHPSLSLDFRMSVKLNPRISVGSTPFGHRNWISFKGGSWSGSWGSGIVLPGGQDSQIIIPDGSARLETNYLLETYDNPPAYIVIKTHGWRTGPPHILSQLADPATADNVDPNSYKFRLFIEMETGDERYKDKVNCGMWVGSGMRKGAEVIYDAYRLS
ncbi:hypothetical protein BGZ60DRAFT_418524 [Tricladium varicosporioides]|nr:hypothetical protein BGZ60DRAFT_418524 [Hymenoscyphus varicosporioides]